jgi:hypothetical protein
VTYYQVATTPSLGEADSCDNADAGLMRDKASRVFGPENSLFSKPDRPSRIADSISSQIREGRGR